MIQFLKNLLGIRANGSESEYSYTNENTESFASESRTLRFTITSKMSRVAFEQTYSNQQEPTHSEIKMAQQEAAYMLPLGKIAKVTLVERSHNKNDGYSATFECDVSGVRKAGTGIKCSLHGLNIDIHNRKEVYDAIHRLMLFAQLDYTEIQFIEVEQRNYNNEIRFEYWLRQSVMSKYIPGKGKVIKTFDSSVTLSKALRDQYIDSEHYFIHKCTQSHNSTTSNILYSFDVEYWPVSEPNVSGQGIRCKIKNDSVKDLSARDFIDYHLYQHGGIRPQHVRLLEFRPGSADFDYWSENGLTDNNNITFQKRIEVSVGNSLEKYLKDEGHDNPDYFITDIESYSARYSKNQTLYYTIQYLPKNSQKYGFDANRIGGIVCKIIDNSQDASKQSTSEILSKFFCKTGISPDFVYVTNRSNDSYSVTLLILYWVNKDSKELYEKKKESLQTIVTKNTVRNIKDELYEEYIDYVEAYPVEYSIYRDERHQMKVKYIAKDS